MRFAIVGFSACIIVAVLACDTPAQSFVAANNHYVVIWGAQRPVVKDPRYAHSFATFFRESPDGSVDQFTISWLPVDGQVHMVRVRAQTGRNWGLKETLELCRANRMEVARWGPYQIDGDLWERAIAQRERLESGEVRYKAFDRGANDGTVSNCVHAISIMVRPPRREFPIVFVAPDNWGESGSYWTTLALEPHFVEPCRTHDRLLAVIDIDPATYPSMSLDRNPTRNPITRAVQAAFHLELLPNRVNCVGR